MAGFATYLSILTLNFNGFNSPIKRQHLANWLKRKIRQSVVYKRPTLLTKINTG
jgi:hypothetical protein